MQTHEEVRASGLQSPPSRVYPSYHQHADKYQDPGHGSSLGEYSDIIERISDLVDRYWNGSKSLIGNLKFRGMNESLWRFVYVSFAHLLCVFICGKNCRLRFILVLKYCRLGDQLIDRNKQVHRV